MVMASICLIIVILMALPITLKLSGILDSQSDLAFSIGYGGMHWRKKISFNLKDLPQAFFESKSPTPNPTETKVTQNLAVKKKDSKKTKKQSGYHFWTEDLNDYWTHLKKAFAGFTLHHLEVEYTLGLGQKDRLGVIAGLIWSLIGAYPQLEKQHIFLHFKPDFEKNGQLLAFNGMVLVPLGHIIVSCLFFAGLYGKRFLTFKMTKRLEKEC